MKQEITPILENYLESIYNLEVEKNFKEAIRITDIANFILSVENSNNYISIMILGIKLTIKKKHFIDNKFL